MSYEPRPVDIQWARDMVYRLKDGGMMGYPATRLSYQVNKTDKVITLVNPDQLKDPESLDIHLKTIDTFKVIGYTVVQASPVTEVVSLDGMKLDENNPRKA